MPMEHAAKGPRFVFILKGAYGARGERAEILELPTDDGHYRLQECHRVFLESTEMFIPDYKDDIVFDHQCLLIEQEWSNPTGFVQ